MADQEMRDLEPREPPGAPSPWDRPASKSNTSSSSSSISLKGEFRRRSNSATAQPRVIEDVWTGRAPSPVLLSEIEFREESLVDYYFEVCFVPQFKPKVLPGTEIPSNESVRALINTNMALRHAVCALAALTFPSNPAPPTKEILAHLGMALSFLRRAIVARTFDEGLLLAIIELVDFERSSGNFSNWRVHFDAAISVLVELPFLQNDMLAFTALQLFFVRRLSFSDIIVATALCRPPVMFLRHIHNLNMGLGVHNLVGCSDRTLAVINQGAELDAWKAQKRSMGELSIGDLYKKGTRILMQLWDGGGMAEGIGPIITEIYRCSTVIYLNVVMSGAFSGINEVKKAIPYLVESVKLLLPHTDALRLLCWPILVGGTLAVHSTHRQVLKEACVRMDGLGDFHQVLIILERAWSERDARVDVETHWRSIMDEFGWTFLFN